MILDGISYSKRSHAGHRLMQFLDREITALTRSSHPRIDTRPGHLGGFDVTTATRRVLGTVQVTLAIDGVPESEIPLTAKDLADTDPAGLVIRLENRLTGLETLRTRKLNEIDRLGHEAARAREDTSKPFPQADQLAAARDRARQINKQLEEAARPPAPEDHDEASGVVMHDVAGPPAARAAPRWNSQAVQSRSAHGSTTLSAVNGTRWEHAAAGAAIPGSQAPSGTAPTDPVKWRRSPSATSPKRTPSLARRRPRIAHRFKGIAHKSAD